MRDATGIASVITLSDEDADVSVALLIAYRAAPKRRRLAIDRVSYEEDQRCQHFVGSHPGGATLGEIAAYLGVTRERVRQIECQALQKLADYDAGLLEALFRVDVDGCSL